MPTTRLEREMSVMFFHDGHVPKDRDAWIQSGMAVNSVVVTRREIELANSYARYRLQLVTSIQELLKLPSDNTQQLVNDFINDVSAA